MQQSRWKKPTLVFIVCCGHLALIVGLSHNLALRKTVASTNSIAKNLPITVRHVEQRAKGHRFDQPEEQAGEPKKAANKLPVSVQPRQSTASSDSVFQPRLHSDNYFLNSDEVAKTAGFTDDFARLLSRLLPANIEIIVLEFWIEQDGRTVEVKCIDGDCTDEVIASLPKLTEIHFYPAFKNGEAVANRKVIQINLKAEFDL